MLKKFWDFIKRIFNKNLKALPEPNIGFEGAISAAENTSSFLENNDELILTIEKNPTEEKANVNIEVLRNGKKIETESEELNKEKVVTYLKNIDIEKEDEIIEEVEEIAWEQPIYTNDTEPEIKPLILETEVMQENEEISNLINGECVTENIVESNEEIFEKNVQKIENDNKEVAKEYFNENEKCENFETSVNFIKAFGINDLELEEIVRKNRNILTVDSDDVLENLNSLTNAGFFNKDIYQMIKKEPEILTDINIKDCKSKINMFKEKGLDGSEVYSLYINNPNLLLLETKRMEQSFKIIKKFYRTKERIHYIMKYFPKAIGMLELDEIRKCVEKM